MSKSKTISVAALAETFRQKLSEVAIKLYVRGLRDLTDQQVVAAVDVAIQRSKYFPSCAELLEMSGAAPPNPAEEAELAWAELDQALNNGSTGPLSDRIKRCVEQMGGGSYLMKLPMREFEFKRSQFLKLYKAGVKQTLAQIENRKPIESLAHLAGTTLRLKDGSAINVKETQ